VPRLALFGASTVQHGLHERVQRRLERRTLGRRDTQRIAQLHKARDLGLEVQWLGIVRRRLTRPPQGLARARAHLFLVLPRRPLGRAARAAHQHAVVLVHSLALVQRGHRRLEARRASRAPRP